MVVAPGRGKVVFYQFRQPKFFQESFSGFALLHRALYGPAAGAESCPLIARRPVPEQLRSACAYSRKKEKKAAKKPREARRTMKKQKPREARRTMKKQKPRGRASTKAKRAPRKAKRTAKKPAAKRQRRA